MPTVLCRSKLLPTLRDIGLTSTVSRWKQISNDCTMVRVVSDSLLRRLQSVLNAAAWLVFSARKSEHITPLLCELHWLRVPEMIKFRLCVLAFWCLHGTAPRYLAETLHMTTSRSSCSLLPRQHRSFQLHDDGSWVIVHFQLQPPVPGTLCHLSSEMNSHWWPFDGNWRQYFSGHPLARMVIPQLHHC